MSTANLERLCQNFASATAPFLRIRSEADYEQALQLIESLLEKAQDDLADPLNPIIEMLGRAIERFENEDEHIRVFERQIEKNKDGLAFLRVLMDQHQLGVADLPELGTKSLVSRILSGQRNLTKNHIQALSNRFQVSPALFFDTSI